MQYSLSSFLTRFNNPTFQAISTFVLCLILMLCTQLLKLANIVSIETPTFWTLAGTVILFFAIFNSVISLSAPDVNKYWFHSTLSYVALVLSNSGLAYFFSGQTITEAGTFRWIFFVLTFGYFFFLSVMRLLRKIVFIAQQEDDKWMKRLSDKDNRSKK